MEDLVKLTEDLVLAIVSNKEAVKVNASEVDEQTIQIDVLVDEKDMPILIGRKGKVVNSIRTLLHASSYLHSKKNIKLNVEVKEVINNEGKVEVREEKNSSKETKKRKNIKNNK